MRLLLAIAALTTLTVASPATAQSAVTTDTTAAQRSPSAQVSTDEALDNLQKAAAELSRAVEIAAVKIANNPEIKTAALQVAAGAVSVAQQSLAEHLKMIEAALNAAARQIAAAQTANVAKAAPATQTPSK